MKYRIEDGEVKMPISELNRLNDEIAELEYRERRIDSIEKKLKENAVATKIEIIKYNGHYGIGLGCRSRITDNIKEAYSDLDGVLKKAVEAETKRMQFYLDEKNNEIMDGNRRYKKALGIMPFRLKRKLH